MKICGYAAVDAGPTPFAFVTWTHRLAFQIDTVGEHGGSFDGQLDFSAGPTEGCGEVKVPFSKRLAGTRRPVPSQWRSLRRLRLLLMKVKLAPLRGSSRSWRVTSTWGLSKLLCRSQGSSARKKYRRPESVSIGGKKGGAVIPRLRITGCGRRCRCGCHPAA
jgi:hypothetical protein